MFKIPNLRCSLHKEMLMRLMVAMAHSYLERGY